MDGMILLEKARAAGLTIAARGDQLVIKGSKRAGGVAKELLQHKAAVLAALAASSAPPAEVHPAIADASENTLQTRQPHAQDAEQVGSQAAKPTVEPPASASGAEDNHGPVAQEDRTAGGAEACPIEAANLDQINTAWCDLSRLAKATLAVAIIAGNTLTTAERESGDAFSTFIATRTPWHLPEAEALIRFARQAGLDPNRLTPAVAVPLGRMLEAAALLGGLYMEMLEPTPQTLESENHA